MNIENLEKAIELNKGINRINLFINVHNEKQERLMLENEFYGIYINKEYEHEIINALEKIKSNMIEELKELGVEVW